MKTYLRATSVLFGLLVIVHVWRAIVEPHLATDPFYILMTTIAAALCVWSWRLLRRTQRG
jgi:hypothetical protein